MTLKRKRLRCDRCAAPGPLYPIRQHPNYWLCNVCEGDSKPITKDWPIAHIEVEQIVNPPSLVRKFIDWVLSLISY